MPLPRTRVLTDHPRGSNQFSTSCLLNSVRCFRHSGCHHKTRLTYQLNQRFQFHDGVYRRQITMVTDDGLTCLYVYHSEHSVSKTNTSYTQCLIGLWDRAEQVV